MFKKHFRITVTCGLVLILVCISYCLFGPSGIILSAIKYGLILAVVLAVFGPLIDKIMTSRNRRAAEKKIVRPDFLEDD